MILSAHSSLPLTKRETIPLSSTVAVARRVTKEKGTYEADMLVIASGAATGGYHPAGFCYGILPLLAFGVTRMTAPVVPYNIPATLLPNLLRITADQYHTMIDEGVIPNGAPYELLDGFIVHKDRARLGGNPLSHDPIHVLAVKLLTRLAARLDNSSCHMQLQLPIALSPLYEPEPDAAIIRGTPEDFRTRLPVPADVICVIEAAQFPRPRPGDQARRLCRRWDCSVCDSQSSVQYHPHSLKS